MNTDLIIAIWVIGWMYACGVHYKNKNCIKKSGSPYENIDKGGYFQYLIIFLFWPYFLGS